MKYIAFLLMIMGLAYAASDAEIAGCMKIKRAPNESTSSYCPTDCVETPVPQPVPEPCCQMGYDSRLQVGGNYTYAWVSPEGNSTVSGSLGGAQFLYEYRPLDFVYAGVAFSYTQGKTDNAISTRKLLNFDVQERVGYTWRTWCKDTRIALYTGFGARYLGEEVSAGTSSVDFNYTHFYVPVGIACERNVNCWFKWGLNFQWKPQVLPMVVIEPLDGSRWILTRHLDNFLVDVPLYYIYSDRFSVCVDPFFELWHDGHTTAETLTELSLSLPDNKYIFTGVNVNLVWSF